MHGTLDCSCQANDPVTGFLPRATFLSVLDARIGAEGRPLPGLVMLDIDRFNEVNDGFGPQRADELLQKAAQRIARAACVSCAVGRMSGNEFAILVDDGELVESVVGRLKDLFSRPFILSGQALHLRLHLGSVAALDDLSSGMDLLHVAGIALNACRRKGPGHVRFTPEMGREVADAFRIEADLRRTILEHTILEQEHTLPDPMSALRLFPVFQPKIGLKTGALASVEVLCRWRDDTGRIVGPACFMPIADRAGLMDALTVWMLRATISALRELPESLTAAVNVAPSQLQRHEWLRLEIVQMLEESGVHPARLEVEVTENVVGLPIEAGVRAMADMGLKLWVDDFGTGEASLARLVTLPFSGVKLDKSIVDTMMVEAPGRAEDLIGAIQAIAFSLSMESVAEGIEHGWQAERIAALGVDYGQGYHFAAPLDLQALHDFIETQERKGG